MHHILYLGTLGPLGMSYQPRPGLAQPAATVSHQQPLNYGGGIPNHHHGGVANHHGGGGGGFIAADGRVPGPAVQVCLYGCSLRVILYLIASIAVRNTIAHFCRIFYVHTYIN